MKKEKAHSRVVLATDDGVIHVPFTLYLNAKYDNPHTIDTAARALRIFGRFVDAFDIDIAARALEARCLTEVEKQALRQLVYYPVEKIEAMSSRAVRTMASAVKDKYPARIKGTVQANTAIKSLIQIAEFLSWYHKTVLNPRMPLASPVTEALRREYQSCAKYLKEALGGTKQMHSHTIRSVPNARLLDIYRAVFFQSAEVLQTDSGKPGRHLMRDRAMILLAAEGFRPGALGNINLADFKWLGGKAPGHIKIKDNTAQRSKLISTNTPVQKGARNHQYNSEVTVSIWPTTASAIREYIDGERQKISSSTLRNKSEGFLFVADHGGPISDRSTITTVFTRARNGLRRLGLLAKDPIDPYLDGEEYAFSAYLLRHSAAALFYSIKTQERHGEVVKDLMRPRFGWTENSQMPSLYARRAMSDEASLTAEEFMESLLNAADIAKNATGEKAK